MSADRREFESLERELLVEQIRFYRAANEEAEREKREREFELFLARRFGYSVPRGNRR